MNWMIIYPKGKKSVLDIAQVSDYEEHEWALASRHRFTNDEVGKHEAYEYMKELAEKHGLRLVKRTGEHDYLD